MVMDWKSLEGRVFEIENNRLTDEQISQLKKLDVVESVEIGWDSSSMGVSKYYRLVLKKKTETYDKPPQDVLDLIPGVTLTHVCHPARLMGYYGVLTEKRVFVRKPLTTKDIAKIEKKPWVVYFQDLSTDGDLLYIVGTNIPASIYALRGSQAELGDVRLDIRLGDLEKIVAH